MAVIGRLIGRSRRVPTSTGAVLARLEEKQRGLAAATEQWLSLLREMESAGESGDPRYDRYYQAYLEARQQQKRVELELFNWRQGLVES